MAFYVEVGHQDRQSGKFSTPPALSQGGTPLKRARYQEGCLTRSKRKSGAVWEYRYRERQQDGSKRMRCIVVGTVAALKTRAAALQRIEVLRANVNREIIETGSSTVTTFKSLIEHYREREMRMDNHDKKAYSTKKRNESYLRKWIVPRWGATPPQRHQVGGRRRVAGEVIE